MKVAGGRDGVDRIRSLEEQVRRLRIRKPPSAVEPPEEPIDIAPLLAPGWSSEWGYYYKHLGRVYFRGRIGFDGSGTPEQAQHILTMPAGYRPSSDLYPMLVADPANSETNALTWTSLLETNGDWGLIARYAPPFYPTDITNVLFTIDHISYRHA